MREKESTIPVRNIGRCPVGICNEVHSDQLRTERVETKLNIVAAGVAAVFVELTIVVFHIVGKL